VYVHADSVSQAMPESLAQAPIFDHFTGSGIGGFAGVANLQRRNSGALRFHDQIIDTSLLLGRCAE
jgi:hypothetical protein